MLGKGHPLRTLRHLIWQRDKRTERTDKIHEMSDDKRQQTVGKRLGQIEKKRGKR